MFSLSGNAVNLIMIISFVQQFSSKITVVIGTVGEGGGAFQYLITGVGLSSKLMKSS